MFLKERVLAIVPDLEPLWPDIKDMFRMQKIPAKTTLLEDGEISKYLYMVSKGCLRLFVIKEDGREITVQFFFENQMVASMESAFTGKPGKMYLETIEESELIKVRLKDCREIGRRYPGLEKMLINVFQQRLIYYANLYTSFILYTPEERYEKLQSEHPVLLERIPHHYIASFLGITPVSLSRIRSRIAKKNLH